MCWPSRLPAEGVAEKAWQGLCDVLSYTTRRLVVEFFQVLQISDFLPKNLSDVWVLV